MQKKNNECEGKQVECVKIYLDSRVKWRAICGGKKIRGDDI
jgi:hypothetical protein